MAKEIPIMSAFLPGNLCPKLEEEFKIPVDTTTQYGQIVT